MGLAEPRKRVKLSHDPRNLQWSQAPDSFGAKIMQSSGWTPGTALGASSMPVHESTAAQVRIAVKDNMLGLGASLKSRNVEHQRTGLDAFQGLLGRLNAKDAAELQKAEEKVENRKLVMFAQGRWGGMVFVPGGLLVQEDPTKLTPQKHSAGKTDEDVDMADRGVVSDSDDESDGMKKPEKKRKREGETPEERAQRKAEKKQRKEDKRARKADKKLKKLQSTSGTITPISDLETKEASTGTFTPSILRSGTSTPVRTESMKNGRHLLRGRNIQAKRAAFSDAKGLDQIFMRQQQTA